MVHMIDIFKDDNKNLSVHPCTVSQLIVSKSNRRILLVRPCTVNLLFLNQAGEYKRERDASKNKSNTVTIAKINRMVSSFYYQKTSLKTKTKLKHFFTSSKTRALVIPCLDRAINLKEFKIRTFYYFI